MKTFSERMVEALRVKGADQTEVANAVGSTPQAIQYLCDKGQGSALTSAIAEYCGVRGLWLEKGKGPKLLSDLSVNNGAQSYLVGTNLAQGETPTNISGAEALEKRKVPIMTTEQIFDEVKPQNLNDENHSQWQLAEQGVNIDSDTFVTIMQGSSMTSPDHPRSIPAGANIYAKPSTEPMAGKIVIVKDINNKSLLVKLLEKDGPNSYLMSLNQQYAPITLTSDYIIVGVAFAIGTFKQL
ncbi:MAG: hypothetical protein JKY93_02215 [Gammaproteobacteria bacterium]|nr:hypothetical protein [Gammaproteobacteria bacterium]